MSIIRALLALVAFFGGGGRGGAPGCVEAVSIAGPQTQTLRRSSKAEIADLPGLVDDMQSRQYSGYITVDDDHGRKLWYWLVESERDPSTDPVILWLTGGPGCSTLDAFIYEHGPFTFAYADGDEKRDGSGSSSSSSSRPAPPRPIALQENRYAWSKAATVVYVDSPAGTGLSYSRTRADYATNDTATASDLLAFLQQLLIDEFPHLAANPLYIAGESYAGVYVPMLAARIADHNQRVRSGLRRPQQRRQQEEGGAEAAVEDAQRQRAWRRRRLGEQQQQQQQQQQPTVAGSSEAAATAPVGGRRHSELNLIGYIIGNGVTDDVVDGNAQVPFAYGMGMLDDPTHAALLAACGGGASFWNASAGSACDAALTDLDDLLYYVNPYDVLAPCKLHGTAAEAEAAVAAAGAEQQEGAFIVRGGASVVAAAVASGAAAPAARLQRRRAMLRHVVACGDRQIAIDWLGRAEVRRALHAPSPDDLEWQPCSDVLSYTHDGGSMIPLHRRAVAEDGLRVLIYSGDHDYVVPFTGTRAWVGQLGLGPASKPWAAWLTGDGQVAGFYTQYRSDDSGSSAGGGGTGVGGGGGGSLTFATVKGAGHMVPQTSPQAALDMLLRFLDHGDLRQLAAVPRGR